nr:uncharacterized protein LOC129051255 [Pongo abelii]
MPPVTHIHTICCGIRQPPRVVTRSPPRIRPCSCLHVSCKARSAFWSPRAFRSGAGHCSFEGGGRQRADGSVKFQLTLRLETYGIIVCCSEALPASPDVVSPSYLTGRGPKSDLNGSPQNTAGVLKLPFPRWKSAQGDPEGGAAGDLALGQGTGGPLSHRVPSWTPYPHAAAGYGSRSLAAAAQRGHYLKGTQPDCQERSASRSSQCACARRERLLPSQCFPRLS